MTREEARGAIKEAYGNSEYTDEIIKALEQEPKKGHWIDITNKSGTVIAVRCSCCEKSPKHATKSDYCPNCGAKMESEEE